jgi:hypothetical protein
MQEDVRGDGGQGTRSCEPRAYANAQEVHVTTEGSAAANCSVAAATHWNHRLTGYLGLGPSPCVAPSGSSGHAQQWSFTAPACSPPTPPTRALSPSLRKVAALQHIHMTGRDPTAHRGQRAGGCGAAGPFAAGGGGGAAQEEEEERSSGRLGWARRPRRRRDSARDGRERAAGGQRVRPLRVPRITRDQLWLPRHAGENASSPSALLG